MNEYYAQTKYYYLYLEKNRLHSDGVINSIAADRGSRIAGTEA